MMMCMQNMGRKTEITPDDVIKAVSNSLSNLESVDVLGFSSEHIDLTIDNKEYVISLKEVKEGEHWCEKINNEKY